VDERTAPEHREAVIDKSFGSRPLLDPAPVLHPVELSIDVVSSLEGLRALKPDYERLERVTANTLPFTLPEWHLTWCEHVLNRQPQREEQLQLLVLRNRSGDCVAIVPLVLDKWHVGPLQLSTVDLLGDDQGITEIRGALIEPGYERASVRRVHQHLDGLAAWKWLEWRDADDALALAVTLELRPRWYKVRDDWLLDLPQSWEEFRRGLPRNTRESLRHCYNSLRRDGHRFEFLVARTRAEVSEALGRFLELHTRRANMSWGVRHPNRFAGRAQQEFLYDVCDCLAACDAVRVFQLRIGRAIVAARVGFIVGDSMYLYYSGFDPAWARYSVMTTAVAEAIRYAISAGLRTVNLSLTSEQSKLRWSPRLVEYHSGLLMHRQSLSSRLVYGAYRMVTSGRGAPARLLKNMLRSHREWN